MATRQSRPSWTFRRAVAVTAAAGTLFAVGACGSSTAAGDGGSSVGTPSASGSSGSAGDIKGDLHILVSSADASDAAFRAINEAFSAKYPDVKVDFSSVPNDSYPATKSSRLTANNVDIFVVKSLVEVPEYAKGSESDDALLAEGGGLVDLTNEPFMKDYTPSVLQAQAFKGKQYMVPTGLSYSTGVYYNKKIFSDNGIDVPTTWDELVAACDKLEKAGVTPFGIGGKDEWPAGLLMLGSVASLYPTLDDKQQLAKDLWEQKVKLTDEGPQGVLEKVAKIYSYAQKNFAGTGYDQIPAEFAKGDFAMTADGTWNEPTIAAAVGDKFDIGYFPFPGSDNADDNKFLNGKIELQLAVSAGSKNKDAALAWLGFFSDPANYKTFVAKSGFSSAEPNIPATDFLDSIADYTSTYQPAWDQVWTANNKAGSQAVYPFNYPAIAPMGKDDAAGAAAAAETDWSAAF